MCGFVGIHDLAGEPVSNGQLERLISVIRHRGPDDDGTYVDKHMALVVVRLAIVDVSLAGHQPMRTTDGRYVLAYNGELYNFRELRSELERRGRHFSSRTDTEVVLHAYAEWGAACLERFDGMFAFACWDTVERRLFVARDRFGVKPLYYARDGSRVIFSSEIKGILETGYRVEVNPTALADYFTFQNVFSDETLFKGIHMLPAGHSLTVDGRSLTVDQYWDFEPEPDETVSEAEWIERVRSAFGAAVTRQLQAEVPLGSYLSGGMDSASIAAVALRKIPRLMTFTGGFDLSSVEGLELVYDERDDAERVSSLLRTEHYEMVMHAGDMAWVLPELVWHLEDLRVGMCYQNHYIARLASKFVKVALAGTGGDELFAGYPWRYDLVAQLDDPIEFERRHFGYWSRLVSDEDKPRFFTSATWESISGHSALDSYRRVIAPVSGHDPVSKALYFEFKTFLHGLLVVEDKVSMAHSLEVRVPFLDNELVEIARSIPPRLKHRSGEGKPILRAAMESLLPAAIVEKKKQGFSPPDQSWYRGETMAYISDILRAPRTIERGYFEPSYVERILAEHFSGKVNHRLLIWSLLAFEWWNRIFVDGEATVRHQAWHAEQRSPTRDTTHR